MEHLSHSSQRLVNSCQTLSGKCRAHGTWHHTTSWQGLGLLKVWHIELICACIALPANKTCVLIPFTHSSDPLHIDELCSCTQLGTQVGTPPQHKRPLLAIAWKEPTGLSSHPTAPLPPSAPSPPAVRWAQPRFPISLEFSNFPAPPSPLGLSRATILTHKGVHIGVLAVPPISNAAHGGGGDAGGVMGGLLAMESPSGLKHSCAFPVTKRLLLQFPVHVIRKRHVDVGAYEA
jgi:hypothetical protein